MCLCVCVGILVRVCVCVCVAAGPVYYGLSDLSGGPYNALYAVTLTRGEVYEFVMEAGSNYTLYFTASSGAGVAPITSITGGTAFSSLNISYVAKVSGCSV